MNDLRPTIPNQPRRFMDQLKFCIRARNLSYQTEKTYCKWVADYIRFHNMQHPSNLEDVDVESYLSELAVRRQLAVNTQKTALNAIAFMYQRLLKRPLGQLNFSYSNRETVEELLTRLKASMEIIMPSTIRRSRQSSA